VKLFPYPFASQSNLPATPAFFWWLSARAAFAPLQYSRTVAAQLLLPFLALFFRGHLSPTYGAGLSDWSWKLSGAGVATGRCEALYAPDCGWWNAFTRLPP